MYLKYLEEVEKNTINMISVAILSSSYLYGTCCVHKRQTRSLQQKKTPWPESVSELYQPRDLRLSAK
jgi:hypothetical protein